MKNYVRIVLACILFLPFGLSGSQLPKKIVFGYFESGPYLMHKATTNELKEKLRIYAGDKYEFEFTPTGYFSADWDRELSRAMARELIRHKEIDMVLAAGPWVAEDLISAGFHKPIIAVCQFDPLSAGLIDQSGIPVVPNLTLTYRPDKIRNDLAAMKRLFPDKPVGFIYFPEGPEFERLRSRMEKISVELDIPLLFSKEISPQGKFSYFISLQKFQKDIAALYLPPLWGLDLEQIRGFLFETQSARIATFASDGFLLLEKDATASNAIRPYRAEAAFCAKKIIAVAEGALPASLPTILEESESLCLNLEGASKIGVSFGRRTILDAKIIPARLSDSALNLTLPLVLEQALQENAGYLARGQIYERTLAEAAKAYSAFYPELELELSAASSNYGILSSHFDDRFRRKIEWGAFAEQKIFSYPAIKELQAVNRKKELGRLEHQEAELALKTSVVEAYLGVLEAEDKLTAQNEITDRLLDLRETLTALAKAGYGGLSELPLIEQRLTEAKITLIEFQRDLKVARTILSVLINRPGISNFNLDRSEFLPEIMSGMVRKYEEYLVDQKKEKKLEQFFTDVGIQDAPSMKASELAIGLQRNMMSQKGKWYLPELSVRGGYSYGSEFYPKISKRRDYWMVGGTLSFPISVGRNFFGGNGVEKARLEELTYRKDELRFEKMQEISAALDELVTRITTLPMNYFHRNLSSTSLNSAREELDAGEMSLADFIYQEEKNSISVYRTISDRFGFFYAYARLFHEVGTGYLIHGSPEEAEFYRRLENYLNQK